MLFGALLLSLAFLCPGRANAQVVWQPITGYVNDYLGWGFGGEGPYSWKLVSGEIPPGLAITNEQFAGMTWLVISGTPSKEGTYDFNLFVTPSDGKSPVESWIFKFIIKPEYAMSISPKTAFLPNGRVDDHYSQTFTVTDGVPPYRWSVTGEPPNLSITTSADTKSCELSGITTTMGTYSLEVSVTDSAGFTKTRAYKLRVTNAPYISNSNPLPNGLLYTTYNVQLIGKLGTPPYTYSVTGLSLPPGLSMGTDGLITGTPAIEGTYQVGITITDSSMPAKSTQQQFTINVYGLNISPSVLPNGLQGSYYPLPANEGQTKLTVTGGKPPIRFRVIKGKIPPGIGWYVEGDSITFRGNPRAGDASFTLIYSDSTGHKGEQKLAFTVAAIGTPTISTAATLPNGKVGETYSLNLQATGGTLPYVWKALKSPPPGLKVEAAGAITGIPSLAGTYSIPVQLISNNRKVTTQTFSLTVDP